MCGIVGMMTMNPVAAGTIAGMNQLLRHRGPDDEGFVLFGDRHGDPLVCSGPDTDPSVRASSTEPMRNIDACRDLRVCVALGHRRLSIVDVTAAGHQPMCSANRRYWMVYNGELYNHAQLRAELERHHYRFHSHCDTEVVLAAYQHWGEECLQRFKGMWSIAIYDRQCDELVLFRDRFGIKPLYYWIAPDGTFCFSSEIKSFTAHPGWSAALNSQRAYDFLVWGVTDHTEETLFSGVYHVRAGHALRLPRVRLGAASGGPLPTTAWYTLRPAPFAGDFSGAVAGFREHFSAAVESHLHADVPVGSCLSGGLDSSAIVCVANGLLKEQGDTSRQKSFSACTHDQRIDERKWVDEVVHATGIDAHYVYPDIDALMQALPRIVWHQDEPFGSTSIFAQWSVFEQAAQHGVKVMLDGQGADELLAGYHSFFGPRFAGLLRSGQWGKFLREMSATRRRHGYSAMHLAMWTADTLLPESIRQPLRRQLGQSSSAPNWLDHARLGATPRYPFAGSAYPRNSIQAASITQLTATNLQMLLRFEDRDSMAHSIESRVPFLDHDLVEYVLGLPDDFKLAHGVTKRVQRVGMASVMPESVRNRMDKIAFQTPEEAWMRQQGTSMFRRKLAETLRACDGILTREAGTLFDEMIAGKRAYNSVAWRWIAFGEWMAAFGVAPQDSATLARPAWSGHGTAYESESVYT